MERVARTTSLQALRRLDLTAIALWLIPAVLVVYLALQNGGYNVIERSEVGIAVWWIVIVGAVVGALPTRTAISPATVALFGAFAVFALWTTLSLAWTESDERTAIEIARVASYGGVFALALGAQSGERWRPVLGGLVTGVSLVLVLAVMSRLQPNLFPDQVAGDYFPGVQLERRLSYPLNYSTGLATLGAMAIPLLLAVAGSAKHLIVQAVAAALVAVALFTLWLTASSLFIPLGLIALIAYVLLTPDRLATLATIGVSAVGAAILIVAIEQHDVLDSGVVTAAAIEQGDEMTVTLVVVCTGVALMQAGLGLLLRHGQRPAWLTPSRKTQRRALWIVIGFALLAAVATPLRGELGTAWDKFRAQSEFDTHESSRLEQVLDPSSRGRYQFWESALDAGRAEPLTGIGAGSFEFFWARNRDAGGFARDAHSLYAESFAELGIVGLLLIVAFTAGIVVVGVRRALRAPPPLRFALAGAASAMMVFVAAAAVDWMWELALLPAIFVTLGAIALVAGRDSTGPATAPIAARATLIALGVAAIAMIVVPLASSSAIFKSRSAVADSQLSTALEHAGDAAAVEPYAATPELQRALVLEQAGALGPAVLAAEEAAEDEPTNWRTWLILSRLQARAGEAAAAVESYQQARSLNPLSPIFAIAP